MHTGIGLGVTVYIASGKANLNLCAFVVLSYKYTPKNQKEYKPNLFWSGDSRPVLPTS
jgi:hypothetical protein